MNRYALDVNVERVEDVLLHKKLLEQAHKPMNGLVFDVRPSQVINSCIIYLLYLLILTGHQLVAIILPIYFYEITISSSLKHS
jgi:hypothetical protein